MAADVLSVTTARPHRAGLKLWLKRLHLWLGLSVGLAFGLIALSGSVLALQEPLLRLAHPALTGHAPPSSAQRAQVLARIALEWTPRGLRAADLPNTTLPVWQLYFDDGTRRYLDPATGELLLTRDASRDILLILRNWHTHLLAGRTGENLLGVLGWIALGLLVSGLVLWWPARGRLRAHLRPYAQPPVRRWLTWHRSLGALTIGVVTRPFAFEGRRRANSPQEGIAQLQSVAKSFPSSDEANLAKQRLQSLGVDPGARK